MDRLRPGQTSLALKIIAERRNETCARLVNSGGRSSVWSWRAPFAPPGAASSRPARRRTDSAHGSNFYGSQDCCRATQVVSDGCEADLQPRLGEPEPAHPTQSVGPLPGSEHLLDPAAHGTNRCIPSLEPGEGRKAAPGRGIDHAWHPAVGPDHVRETAGGVGAVGVDLAGLLRQHRLQHDSVVNVRGDGGFPPRLFWAS